MAISRLAVTSVIAFNCGAAVQLASSSSQTGCSSDEDCPLSQKRSKCCPSDGSFMYGCPVNKTYTGATKACFTNTQPTPKQCTCVQGESCLKLGGKDLPFPYIAKHPDEKQWLMFGDSISLGLEWDATTKAKAKGIQLIHTPGNAMNVWRGSRCMEKWLDDPTRWDVISFNFGLHDVAQSLERIEPETFGKTLTTFVNELHALAPQASLVWATATPAPDGSERECVTGAFKEEHEHALPVWGGCPPRKPTDISLYNRHAAKALKNTGLKIHTVDLHKLVVDRCGPSFTECPGFQKPMEVHFAPEGNDLLAEAYVKAVEALL